MNGRVSELSKVENWMARIRTKNFPDPRNSISPNKNNDIQRNGKTGRLSAPRADSEKRPTDG